jgi:tetratricopeptide (TPR) repeat protein
VWFASPVTRYYLADLEIDGAAIGASAGHQVQRCRDAAAGWGIYSEQGDDVRALQYQTERLILIEQLVARDPANADSQRELGIVEARLASVQRSRGQLDDAEKRAIRAVSILQLLAKRDATLLRRQTDAAAAQVELANVALTRGDLRAAVSAADAALTLLGIVVTKSPSDLDAWRLLAEACLVAADAWQRLGDAERAGALRSRAHAALADRAPTWKERRLQATWARALVGVGLQNEANQVIAQLRDSGFRRDVLDSRRIITP